MANEVIIEEYGDLSVYSNGQMVQMPGKLLASQVLDVATKSAELNAKTKFVAIKSNATAFWFKFGDTNVSATADTDDNRLITANEMRFFPRENDYIDTAADA